MPVDPPVHVGAIFGAGSPNYLNAARSVYVATIGGTEYAFVASYVDHALTIFDVSTPATPVHISEMTGAGNPNWLGGAYGVCVATIGGTEYAFVTSYSDDALTVFDVSTPAVPVHVGEIVGPASPNYLNGACCVVIMVIGGTEYAIVAGAIADALTIFDVSTPATPVHVGAITGAASPNYLNAPFSVCVMTIGGTEYAILACLNDDALSIFDISTPAVPVHAGSIFGAGAPNYLNAPYGVCVATIGETEYAFVAAYLDNYLSVFNISTPAVPVHVGEVGGVGSPAYLGNVQSVQVEKIGGVDYALCGSHGADAITIFNVSTPATPVHAGAVSGQGSPNYLNGAFFIHVATIGGVKYALLTCEVDDSLTIFNVDVAEVPSLLFHDRRAFRGIGRGVL